jgi:hypothetical protein
MSGTPELHPISRMRINEHAGKQRFFHIVVNDLAFAAVKKRQLMDVDVFPEFEVHFFPVGSIPFRDHPDMRMKLVPKVEFLLHHDPPPLLASFSLILP